jgi:aminoglycoside phosphotransferase (APT) family kinase protein
MQKFFTTNDDLRGIIERVIPKEDIVSARHIITGWTNIVIEVTTKNSAFFFRFPRNNFFSKMLVKDCTFCEFIQDRTSFATPQLKLCYDNGRPFSVHKKIHGYSLTDRMRHLSRQAMTNIAYDISKFICELGRVDDTKLPSGGRMKLSDFLGELAEMHFDDKSLGHYEYLKSSEDSTRLVHGDLNPGNILLNENDKVSGIIDFCFAGYGTHYLDVSRIIGRSKSEFRDIMIKSYEDVSRSKVDIGAIDRLIGVWSDIECGYIGYMRRNHPEIKLPE